jgi:F1F0 ATPase subunit 2
VNWEINLPAIVAGFLLGVLFFGGLKLTVRKSILSKRPWLWVLLSMVLRTAISVTGFVMISDGNIIRLLFCTAGFAGAKLLAILRFRPGSENPELKEDNQCI